MKILLLLRLLAFSFSFSFSFSFFSSFSLCREFMRIKKVGPAATSLPFLDAAHRINSTKRRGMAE